MTFYFKYLNVVDQPSDFMNHVYWSAEDTSNPASGSFGSSGTPNHTIRRSLTPFGDTPTTPIAGGTSFVDNEYISVCYDMSINSGGGFVDYDTPATSWAVMGVGKILEHLGSLHFIGGGEGSELLYYGAVLSKIDNTNESIYNPTLPIALVV
jgi:hypothetical protein